jgi:hypothetical protein
MVSLLRSWVLSSTLFRVGVLILFLNPSVMRRKIERYSKYIYIKEANYSMENSLSSLTFPLCDMSVIFHYSGDRTLKDSNALLSSCLQ